MVISQGLPGVLFVSIVQCSCQVALQKMLLSFECSKSFILTIFYLAEIEGILNRYSA